MTKTRTKALRRVGSRVVMGLVLCAPIGCSSGTPAVEAGGAPSAASGAATTGGTVSFVPPDDAPKSYQAAQASADPLILASTDLPGGGWGSGGPKDEDDFHEVVCGVDNEPRPPAGSFFAQRLKPSFALLLIQAVRPVGAKQAQQVVADLGQALETCTTDRRIKSGKTWSYAMKAVPLASTGAVAYRQTRTDKPDGVWTYRVFFAQRDCLVTFSLFSASADPPTDFLDALVVAVRKKG